MRRTLPLFLFLLLLCLPASNTAGRALASVDSNHIWLPLINTLPPPPPPPDWAGSTGSVVCLAVDPANSDVVYAGTWGGGVFRSGDQGDSWAWAGSGLGAFLIDSLVIDPADSRVLYAGTHAGGLFKTIDGGQNWFFSGAGIQPAAAIYSIAIHPGNSQVLYAATRSTGRGINPPYGGVLYKSTDGGSWWFPVLADLGGPGVQDWVYSIAVSASPQVILAASHEHGPYYSNSGDAGSWQPAQVQGFSDYVKGRAIAFDPRAGSGRAFFATWHGGFYRSLNWGLNWDLSTEDLNNAKVFPNGITFGWASPETLYLPTMDTASGVMKSTDGGRSWRSAGLKQFNLYAIAALYPEGNIVLAGTVANGIYKSTNGGTSWSPAVRGLEVHPPAGAALTGGEAPAFPEPAEWVGP